MKQNTEFEKIGDIIKTIKFDFDEDEETKKSELMSKWKDAVGEKLYQYSKPERVDEFGVMFVKCRNSVVSNELFSQRAEINGKLKKMAEEIKTQFRYIKLTK